MKKALVVLLAFAFVAGAFADAPVANLDVAEFTGSATVTWGVDLDAKSTGFKNETEANFKINIADGGEAATSSDNAVWGEIVVKADSVTIENGGLKSGDDGVRVDTAKLHIGPVYMGIMAGGTNFGAFDAPEAVKQQHSTENVGPDRSQGIVLGFEHDFLNFALDFRNPGQYQDDYALRAKLGITAVENLDLNLGFSMAFDEDASPDKGFGANAAYKLAIGDEFYLKPGVGYTNTLAEDNGTLAVGILFGFGGDGEGGLPYFGEKFNAGVSVSTKLDLNADPMVIPLAVGFYSGEIVENLSAAVLLKTDNVENFGDNFNFKAALKYAAAVGDGTITPRAGLQMDKAADSMEVTVGAEFAGFVDNTTFDAEWKSGDLNADKMGTFNVSVKIAL